MNVLWLLATRFRRSRQSGFVSLVSFSSTLGIGLGCAVLILLLSVMNGFERELRDNLLRYIPHAQFLQANPEGLVISDNLLAATERDPRVKAIYPIQQMSGLLRVGKAMKAVELKGVDAAYLQQHFPFPIDHKALVDIANGVYLGKGVMKALALSVGDNVQLLLANQDKGFKAPLTVNLSIVGEINISGEVGDFIAIIDRKTLSNLANIPDRYNTIEFVLYDPFDSYQVVRDHGYAFPQDIYMSDWTRSHGHLYQDIQLVRVVVYIVLILVICVASFNIVSSLVMSVKEKTAHMAILMSMGATANMVAAIFMIMGAINGVIGVLGGVLIGSLSAFYLSDIIRFIEHALGYAILSGDIYFIDFLPSQLIWQDVITVASIGFLLSVAATIYPAWQARRVAPAQELH